MRMSDWSSDVCSSDLPKAAGPRIKSGVTNGGMTASHPIQSSTEAWLISLLNHDINGMIAVSLLWRGHAGAAPFFPPIDGTGRLARAGRAMRAARTSVGEGKGVSVRVDLGVRRH